MITVDQIYFIIGKVVVLAAIISFSLSLIIALLVGISFKTKRYYFARPMLIGISLLENIIKAIFWLARADDKIVDDVGISLMNYINRGKFYATPVAERFIFMPQCLRSIDCPAKLTPEGITCVCCGRCGIRDAKRIAEAEGYKFFIVPGSSFIKRIIQKYHPKGIIGVGCEMEIKEGLILCHSYGIPAIGVPLTKAGCISTTLDWERLYDVILQRSHSEPQK